MMAFAVAFFATFVIWVALGLLSDVVVKRRKR
jgi:hypothetical protein